MAADAFAALAGGAGDRVVVRQLREAQLSKHLMLLRVVVEAAKGIDPPSRATAAFRAGYHLLAEAQATDPGAVSRLLGLPHIGSWAHDFLACLDKGAPPDFGYLAAVAAAAAVRLGVPFELDVPVRDGRVPLPGLGSLRVAGQDEWTRLSSDGERLRADGRIDVPCAALLPDDGSGDAVPHWQGTPLARAVAGGQAWEVLLETADKYLDRYALPMLTVMTPAELTSWRRLLQSAWELLVRHHEWAAGPVAEGVPVIVPLVPRSDLHSATSPAAFGAIATSLPTSPVTLAETLVHEFQHVKLCGLMDMLPLIEPGTERGYAPWREDPRPVGGIVQGVYAFTGIVRFWNVQRHVESRPDDILRASVLYERWRLAIEMAVGPLLDTGTLTPDGVRFVSVLRGRAQCRQGGPVPAEAAEIAREVALDNWLTWQLTHVALDSAGVARLATACQRGEPLGGQALPAPRISDDIRKVDSISRSRLLVMRYQEPGRYRQLSAADMCELGEADALLIRGDAAAAAEGYRARLVAEPDPADWIGLALAIHRLPVTPSRSVFARHLPLLFEMHACLAVRGVHADPLELAAWFE
ncbi:MAG: HEXXH motif domain-containing protein [Trebonia sp.]